MGRILQCGDNHENNIKSRKEIAYSWLYLMCFCSHTFLLPLKSIWRPLPNYVALWMCLGAVKSTLHSALQLCTSVWDPFHHVLWSCVFVWLLSTLMITLGYTLISWIPTALKQYFARFGCSINSWKMNQSHCSFLQKPMVTLHCRLHLIYWIQQHLTAWPQTSFRMSSQSPPIHHEWLRFLLFFALPCSSCSNLS